MRCSPPEKPEMTSSVVVLVSSVKCPRCVVLLCFAQESELCNKRKECEDLEHEVKKRQKRCLDLVRSAYLPPPPPPSQSILQLPSCPHNGHSRVTRGSGPCCCSLKGPGERRRVPSQKVSAERTAGTSADC